ncbi:RNA methyltransferase [Aureitalea sp. L0-47]|uniref:TrmH family RNA methyltransferase n=1 Tax=Aureitalea sp. L0-47 TaxID=2816962 RepID=UPI002237CBA1|nr:RNA methyltransferase [Aureitalea sp. L0-47]MCW5520115.1 RNA methyltransferase [Aureitalea sp. L0-47]
MISKSQIKLITGLRQKKYRDSSGLFVAEGPKVISELLEAGFQADYFFSTKVDPSEGHEATAISEIDLKKISALKTPNTSLAVFRKPTYPELRQSGLILALDAIRDPGNLGTIIRLCDWFGVEQIVCSADTADCFNPKVIQATMGSIARVAVHYVGLDSFLRNTQLTTIGAVMDGASVYQTELPSEGILVMGNEANGISETINEALNLRITIPRFGAVQETESLNVATATAILLNEFRRSTGK